ncbi:hypothetical protein R3P38DRAFT_2565405 [Favolaschia claudopus]|uniref:NAD(P)-binding protein n=1 Tax=Favolaschia claudopus TaxID=2862362 RepID=A0AAV9ZZX2_9AGAR
MPPLAVVESTNTAYHPNYLPVAIVVGATSGVGQAMAEALARQTNGRAHIIIIGRSASTAAKILAGFPKPTDKDVEEGAKHEFVACDAMSLRDVRAVCRGLKARLNRVNYLVMTAGGPEANSMTEASETEEGINKHLAMRYFMRYLFTKELVPLLVSAKEMGQHAHAMTVLGAGMGVHLRTTDLGLHDALRGSYSFLQGRTPLIVALKGMIAGAAYSDGLVAYFAANYPTVAFTHIHPGQVLTANGSHIDMGWMWAPLAWVLGYVKRAVSLSQDERAKYMLYALLDQATDSGGIFIRGDHGDIVSSHSFDAATFESPWETLDAANGLSEKWGVLSGIPLKGYGGSDAAVANLVRYTEQELARILA